jgi:hypothetical protein
MSIRGDQLAREFIDKYCKQFERPVAVATMRAQNGVPRIGAVWSEQGGIYAGMVRGETSDHHLILHKDERDSIQWQPALDWAKTLEAAGHRDFTIPTRREQAILYGNLKDQFKEAYYWSCEQPASDPDYAWVQDFSYGHQGSGHKDYYGRARAVRRVIIQ